MTIDPGAGAIDGATQPTMVAPATLEKLARAYLATYHGPHGDAPTVDAVTGPVDKSAAGKLMTPALMAAHDRLGRQRKVGETRVQLYPATTRAASVPRCRSSPTRRPCCWTRSPCCCTDSAWPTWR